MNKAGDARRRLFLNTRPRFSNRVWRAATVRKRFHSGKRENAPLRSRLAYINLRRRRGITRAIQDQRLHLLDVEVQRAQRLGGGGFYLGGLLRRRRLAKAIDARRVEP